jgi:hypothetical protein
MVMEEAKPPLQTCYSLTHRRKFGRIYQRFWLAAASQRLQSELIRPGYALCYSGRTSSRPE